MGDAIDYVFGYPLLLMSGKPLDVYLNVNSA